MSDQVNGQVSTIQRPSTNDPEAWKTYWEKLGCPWRTEPEIDTDRQKYLAERRNTTPDIEKGIYPFGGIKLNRADVEWLLITHENGRGPVDWKDESQRKRQGLDLRGADLRQVDLRKLPLARLRGGLDDEEWFIVTDQPNAKEVNPLIRIDPTEEQFYMASIHLEGAILREAHLEEAILTRAHLEKAILIKAKLESAALYKAHFQEADLDGAQLTKASLQEALLHKATLRRTQLQGADLRFAELQGAILYATQLQGAILKSAYLDTATSLGWVILSNEEYGTASVGDIRWNGVDLAMINWDSVKILGDERHAHKKTGKEREQQRLNYLSAVRANRQLAVALQSQGLNEDASRFAYRAQKLQRIILRRQKKFGQYLFSGFLDLLAGNGYRPGRSVLWYLVVIFGFALAYFAIGHLPFFPDAFVFSLTSFHGRGFFPGLGSENSLHNPLVILAAFEAVIGLLIEISFIATFTQRFFGR